MKDTNALLLKCGDCDAETTIEIKLHVEEFVAKNKTLSVIAPTPCDKCEEPAWTALSGVGKWCEEHFREHEAQANRKCHR